LLPLAAEEKNSLDANAIDLLVGTPRGIVEPLDQRRKPEKTPTKIDFSEFLQVDNPGSSSFPEIEWQDAEGFGETNNSTDSEATNQAEILDLIADIEELEEYDDTNLSTDFDSKLTDSVETEFKL
jgi:hypothetical protein